MLTNNKKGFVKGIAMIMALLMVLSVCLTGCGNKAADEALNKAEQAQGTADAAKTLADEVKAELAKYLKLENAVDKAAIEAMIDAAFAEFDDSAYATTEALTEALKAYVTSEEFGAFKKELEKYYTSAKVDELLAALKTELAGKIDTNKVSLDSLGTKIETALADIAALKGTDAGQATAESVTAALNKLATDLRAELEAAVNDDFYGNIWDEVDFLEENLGILFTDLRDLQQGLMGLRGTLADYVTKTALDEYKGATDERLAKLEALLTAIIEGLFTPEDLEKLENIKANEDLSLIDLFAGSPSYISAAIMSLKQWDVTTPEVIKAIDGLQTLLTKLFSNTDGKIVGTDGNNTLEYAYTKANKKAINDCFKAIDIKIYNETTWALNDYATIENALKIYILRAPNLASLDALTGMVEAANAVPSFIDELQDQFDLLLTIGCKHTNGSGAAAKTYQVITISDKAAWNTWNEQLDDLLCTYLADTAFANTKYATTFGGLTMQYIYQNPENAAEVVVTASPSTTGYKPNADKAAWTYVDDTVLVEDLTSATSATYLTSYAVNGIMQFKSFTGFDWNAATLPAGVTLADATHAAMDTEDKPAGWANVLQIPAPESTLGEDYAAVTALYKGLWNQFNANEQVPTGALTLVDNANDTFYAFLLNVLATHGTYVDDKGTEDTADDVIVALSSKIKPTSATVITIADQLADITDDEFVAALKDWMVEEIADVTSAPTITSWLYTTVKPAIELAIARNTHDAEWSDKANHSADIKGAALGIDEYELYYKLMDKAWDLMFERYQAYAFDMLDTIVKDYQSVVDYLTKASSTHSVVAGTDAGTYTYTLDTALTTLATSTLEHKAFMTEGFLEAIFNDTGAFTGWTKGGITLEKDFGTWAFKHYYDNNGTAYTKTGDAAAEAVTVDIDAAILADAHDLYLMINSASLADRVALAEKRAATADKTQSPDKAFLPILEDAVAHIEEMFNRDLYAEYQKAAVNELAAKATEFANLYCTDDVTANLVEAMNHYLTGYYNGDAAATPAVPASVATGTANELFPNEAALTNGKLLADLADIEWEGNGTIGDTNAPALNAGAAMGKVDDLVEDYIEVLENMAIKDNYVAFLTLADRNLFNAYAAFNAKTQDTAIIINLFVAYTKGADQIDADKYQAERGTIELMQFKQHYTQLLGMIAGNTTDETAHLYALCTIGRPDTVTDGDSTFAWMLSAVKSSQVASGTLTSTTGATEVVTLGVTADYKYVGTAVNEFDKILNATAEIVGADGNVKLY